MNIPTRGAFLEFFDRTIEPKYGTSVREGIEWQRKKKKKEGVTYGAIVGTFIVLNIFGMQPIAVLLMFLGIPFLIVWEIKNFTGTDETKRLQANRDQVLGEVTDFLLPGFSYFHKQHGVMQAEFEAFGFYRSKYISSYESEDVLIGKQNGRIIRISEGKVYYERGGDNRTTITVFDGLVFEMQADVPPTFQLLFTPRQIRETQGRRGEDLPEISLSDPYLEKHFRIYSNDLLLANKLMQPRNLANVLDVIQQDPYGIQCFGFTQGRFVVLYEKKRDLLEIHSRKWSGEQLYDDFAHYLSSLETLDQLQLELVRRAKG